MKKILSFFFVFVISTSYTLLAADNSFVVVIDAGHGGKDTGATRDSYKEKEINLGVALMLGKLIESNMKDVEVVYTRKSDVFVDLYKRADIANKAKANLFISIHTNSTASNITKASGADTYILGLARSDENLAVAKRENSVILLENNYSKKYEGFDPNSPESNILFEFMTNKYMDQSLEFASYVQNGFATTAKRVDRGVAQAGFLVLRESGMPSVLIELGFINNPTEAKFLTSSVGQRNMASAIYEGFEKYKKGFDKKRGTHNSSNNNSPIINESKSKGQEIKASNTTATPDRVEVGKDEINQPELSSKNIQPSSAENNKTEQAKTNVVNPSSKEENKKIDSSSVGNKNQNFKGIVEYKVQFLTATSKLVDNSPSFKGLSPVDFYLDGEIYKYTYGSASSEREALKLQKQARVYFRDAFVIKFVDGVRAK